jgi:hypothetical protein
MDVANQIVILEFKKRVAHSDLYTEFKLGRAQVKLKRAIGPFV